MPSRHRNPILALALASALAGSSVAAAAAEPSALEGTLCAALSGDELNALSALQYADAPLLAGQSFCSYGAASDQGGAHVVLLSLQSVRSLEEERHAAPRAVDVQIAGRPGFVVTIDDDASVYLEMDDGLLVVRSDIAGSAEGVAIDPATYATQIAGIVVANLDDAAVPALPDESIAALTLPEVEGIELSVDEEAYGEEIRPPEGEEDARRFDVMLEALGADYGQLGYITAIAASAETGEQIGSLGHLRISGADEAGLEQAGLSWLAAALGGVDLVSEATTVGGKDVLLTGPSPELQLYLYATGDSLFMIVLPEAEAAKVLETLP